MAKVGKEGVITVEEAKGMETNLEVVEGMQFDGATSLPTLSPPREDGSRPEEPYILIHEKKVSAMKDLLPVLETIAKMGKPLVIIAETWTAKPWPPWWSISSGAPSRWRP